MVAPRGEPEPGARRSSAETTVAWTCAASTRTSRSACKPRNAPGNVYTRAMSEAENPLLSYRFDVPFDAIRPSTSSPPSTRCWRAPARASRRSASASGPRTYENTLGALDDATEELEHAMAVVGHLEAVATTPALREAYNAVQPKVSAFYAGIPLDASLCAR